MRKFDPNTGFEKKIKYNPGGLLALMWRKALFATRTTDSRESLVVDAILEDKHRYNTDDKTSNGLKHRFLRYVNSDKMSWDVFNYLIFRILKCKNVKVTIEFELETGNQVHKFNIEQQVTGNVDGELKQGLSVLDDKKGNKDE